MKSWKTFACDDMKTVSPHLWMELLRLRILSSSEHFNGERLLCIIIVTRILQVKIAQAFKVAFTSNEKTKWWLYQVAYPCRHLNRNGLIIENTRLLRRLHFVARITICLWGFRCSLHFFELLMCPLVECVNRNCSLVCCQRQWGMTLKFL